ncbi:winged helix DNA-binding domain-containing protein [Halostreptopolyspora alba]|uniref:Winged helix DNA-binding domain-containing protein n=1 Tax=Halostreptopolyspora alba TaxID=2487137 RepID=A0A3N0E3T8_9ACTN|nr:winged helix DNA-binding domain-containing protein [Nocardiopsaceae bacterium YIM 96095]
MTTPHEIALLRLAAQRIAGPEDTVAGVVERLTASQAQDYRGLLTSVALRSAPRTRAAVHAALDAGEAVRSWPMRGTLHLVLACDLPWMLDLLAPRILRRSAGRRAELGLDEPTLERARELTHEALRGGRRLRRADLLALWDEGGVSTAGQRGYHTLAYLGLTGTLCFGPVDPDRDEQRLVLVEEWIPDPRRPRRDDALAELATRFFRGHGPATVADLTRWAGLTATDARTALAAARPRLATVEVDGVEYLMDPETPQRLDRVRGEARGVFLLPGFDEFVLGYADRGAVLPAEYADRLVPGRNGVFRATVVADGRIVGTWKRSGNGAASPVEATPFEEFPNGVAEEIPRLSTALP